MLSFRRFPFLFVQLCFCLLVNKHRGAYKKQKYKSLLLSFVHLHFYRSVVSLTIAIIYNPRKAGIIYLASILNEIKTIVLFAR